MRNNWKKSIALLMDSEGPELNVGGSEPGGASRRGVSVAALGDLHRALGRPPVTVDTIRELTDQQAEEFYQLVTAKACRFDDLPIGVDYVALDATANLGPTGFARLAQCTLGAWPQTDKLTDDVVARLAALRSDIAITALGAAWLAKKRESSGWPRAGHGWTNRMVRVRADALAMARGESA